MKRILFILCLSALSASAKPQYYYREYTDARCQLHHQELRVDDDGEIEVISDTIIGRTTPCNGSDDNSE